MMPWKTNAGNKKNFLTADQAVKNSSYARFINYRTGMQYSWMEYAKAAAAAMPGCNLANYAANANAFQNVICGDAKALNDTVGLYKKNPPCQQVYNMSVSLGEQVYEKQKETLLGTLEGQYRVKCLAAKAIEKFSVTYTNKEYHYTLYYYDMAGSLVKTVPPKGARPDFTTAFTNSVKAARVNNQIVVPPHILATNYRYNSLGQVMAQHTPDAGLSGFWYDKLGRLSVSQNAQQKINNKYSYTLYDLLGRINEVGQKPQAVNSMSQAVSQDPVALNNWVNVNGGVKEQITQTVYDQPYAPFIIPDPLITQKNLRNRVSYTTFKNLANEGLHYTGTFYTYDVHGNVDTLLQDYVGIAAMNSSSNRFKLMAYDYDLISGKVNRVSYQPKAADAFYHKYYYDAENRITSVETSRDKIVWERDAAYNYYKHGPLARMVLGQNLVQGNDYAYTLQGWLKGMNSTTVFSPLQGTGWGFDMGADGGGVNKQVAADVFGFSLNYYNNDYKAINAAAKPFAAVTNAVGLFNGNIAAMAVNLPKIGEPLLYQYRYDQLNRLLKMSASKGLNNVNNTWTPVVLNDYAEDIVYDPNGNILTYKRNGSAAKLDMDKMTYQYPKDALGNALNNRLRYVHDEVAAANYAEDIDSQTALTLAQVQAQKLPEQLTDNYGYDAIGNLIKDTKEGISSIKWNVYGKIESITKMGNTINYSYDAAGNRISKIIGTKSTFYVRDASGNVMSVYSIDPLVNQGKILQSEVHLYGSSRLGIVNALTVAPQIKPVAAGFGEGKLSTFTRGEKFFELSNHLGNVMATVNDKKIAVDGNADGIVDYYTADVVSAQDYAPFGSLLAGRKFGTPGRFGFNGKENDKDISVGVQDYGMRIYDGRLGRFLSVDPITSNYPMLTPYQFASNRPIDGIDLDGLEYLPFHSSMYKASETMIQAPLSQTIVTTVYENIPAQLQNPQTCDVKFVAKGIVTAFGRDYDSRVDGDVVYDADKYYRKDAEFNGTSRGTSTNGIDALKGNAMPPGGTGNVNAGNINSMGSVLGPNGAVGILQNAWNYLLPWSDQSGIDDEKRLRKGFYDAANNLQQNIDMSIGIINTRTGPASFSTKMRNATHNFMTDGTLNYSNTKESMIDALKVAHFGVQMLTQNDVEIQGKTRQAITELLNNYKAAGGGNEYDNISQYYEKKDE